MDVGMNTSAALMQNTSDIVGLIMLKQAVNIEAKSVLALIGSVLPQSPQSAANLPPNLGQNINIIA